MCSLAPSHVYVSFTKFSEELFLIKRSWSKKCRHSRILWSMAASFLQKAFPYNVNFITHSSTSPNLHKISTELCGASKQKLSNMFVYSRNQSNWSNRVGEKLPLCILSWAAEAFFCGPDLEFVSPSFFCCFNENSFIIFAGNHFNQNTKTSSLSNSIPIVEDFAWNTKEFTTLENVPCLFWLLPDYTARFLTVRYFA